MAKPLSALLIDDNPDDRAMTLRALRVEFPGIEAMEVVDADGLLFAFAVGRYDFVIIDYHFVWSNGLEVLPRIKQRQPDCPVIMFTATGSEEVAVKALKSGVDDYIVKSSRNFSKLASAVRNALERKREHKRSMLLEVRLQDLLTRLHVGICRSGLDGKLTYANPSFLKMFGLPRDAGKRGIDIATLLPIPGDSAKWRSELKRDGQMRRPEAEVKLPGGRTVWLAITLSMSGLPDEDGVIETLVEDVTERNRMDRELRCKEEEIRQLQKLESIGRLAGGVAHDFNNLLTAINGYSELLLGMLDEQNPLRESLLEIKKAGTRAAGLTKELLAFSRRQMLQPKEIDLNALIISLEPLLRRAVGSRIGLDLVLDPNPLKVRCDPTQMENVLMNLASNVRDAIAESGKMRIQSGTMEVREKPEYTAFRRIPEKPTDAMMPGSYVVLTIQDTGMGMDAKTLSQIFEPFFTTKGMGKGTGMGLSTAYGIVKQSGGHIFVESQVGQGTTFRICLPSLTTASAPHPAAKLTGVHGTGV